MTLFPPIKARTLSVWLVALLLLAAGLALAAHHPLSPLWVAALGVVVALLCARFEHLWLLLLPALLPVVDLAPWTGWITFEEFDILVLCAAAGAWWRHGLATARHSTNQSTPEPLSRWRIALWMTVPLLALGASFMRGVDQAGDFVWGWFQAYDGPMNALRLAKSMVLAALFVPLMPRAWVAPQHRARQYLAWGLTLGLALCALAAVWERLAFTDLLNFSADYRTTALFWEMHVGGAALDGYLALTLPAAVWLLWHSHNPARFVLTGTVVALGLYATLTTFSRGLYLGAAVALLMLVWPLLGSARALLRLALGALVMLALSALMFRHGGYRALMALLGCLALFLWTLPLARAAQRPQVMQAAIMAVPLAGAALLLGLLPKGVYLAYAALWLLGAASGWAGQRAPGSKVATSALAATWCLPLAAVWLATHWSEGPALPDASVAMLAVSLLALHATRSAHNWAPTGWRQQAGSIVGMVAITAVVAVFGGGAYMGDRVISLQRDMAGRINHWRASMALLHTPADWLLGRGTGRFPTEFILNAPTKENPGGYRRHSDGDSPYMTLYGARYTSGIGDVLRISQRIQPGQPGRYQLRLQTRSTTKARLTVGVCPKHLLYPSTCAAKSIGVPASGDQWQPIQVEWTQSFAPPGAWYAHQLHVFYVALDTANARVDVRHLQLTGPDHQSLLANGNFDQDLSRWFFTSDRHHLPWHAKSLPLHVLVEQGALGLTVLAAMVVLALRRASPEIAAGVVGFVLVGLFDSLLDVPRLAFLFYLLLWLAMVKRGPGSPRCARDDGERVSSLRGA